MKRWRIRTTAWSVCRPPVSQVRLLSTDKKQNDKALKPTEMVPTFQQRLDGYCADDVSNEPLSEGLTNTSGGTPYRVSWYAHARVSPAKAFVYWAYRRLRDLPPEWQEYYRRMLYQEVSASRYVNQTWDCFMMVVDGYRKAKWVLRKYGANIDESLIPRPYNNFWEETTHEERVWAHRRSHQMKEMQALQRDEDDIVFGAVMMDRKEVSYSSVKNLQTGMQGGTPLHAHDLPAPMEQQLRMSRHDEEMSSALMSSIEDDKLWNPVLRSRLHTQRQREEIDLYSFEDDDEFEEVPSYEKDDVIFDLTVKPPSVVYKHKQRKKMADLLSLQQITELKAAFTIFDRDGDGSVTVEDLGDVFDAIGQKLTRKELSSILAEADLDSNGVIDFPEFLTLVAAKLHDPEAKEAELRRAFRLYDLGNTGFITTSNLKYVMGKLGCPLTTEQAFEMISEADTDGDGKLSFDDFVRITTEGSET